MEPLPFTGFSSHRLFFFSFLTSPISTSNVCLYLLHLVTKRWVVGLRPVNTFHIAPRSKLPTLFT
ncbi:hypothetical protein K435DRAFT_778828 [Dendrothele bispora CBS 962.96]|uniref:Uncharacterized protein n=1 Tax=Dendrothele bispora (strain CBS 962.96) TaxID=1314807 RepID=A0A4S8M1V0_DENBC|nr:hypothetical protein K435DRAFT_778828 [Dendrothele bispora CBS 962.96]